MSAKWFASRLRELREQAGLTQPQLAERVGVTTRQISRLETGVSIATWDTAVALATALGVEVGAFTVEPKEAPAPERGRPRKAAADQPGQSDAPKDKPAGKVKRSPAKKAKGKP